MQKYNQDITAAMFKLKEEGLSGTKIAEEINKMFGTNLTRSSVLGKFFRVKGGKKTDGK